jgi:hypothetical protein
MRNCCGAPGCKSQRQWLTPRKRRGSAFAGVSDGPRYTRNVSCRRLVGLIVLATLTALPVSGAVCAMLCDSAASSVTMASAHHHGASRHAARTHPFAEVQIQAVSEHDCSDHDGALRQASTSADDRANWSVTSVPLVSSYISATLNARAGSEPHLDYRVPPGTAPPTTTPLVLRV